MKKILLYLSLLFCFCSCSLLEINHDKKVSYVIREDNILSREDIITLSKNYTLKANFYNSFKYQDSYYRFLGKYENLRRVYMETFIFEDYEELKMFCKDIKEFSKNYISSKNKKYKFYDLKESFSVYTIKNKIKTPEMLFSFHKDEVYDHFWDKYYYHVRVSINIFE